MSHRMTARRDDFRALFIGHAFPFPFASAREPAVQLARIAASSRSHRNGGVGRRGGDFRCSCEDLC